MMNKYWIIADIHGEIDKLNSVMDLIRLNGFSLDDPNQFLVQTGDRNDRGPDSYAVNEFFRTLQLQYEDQVIVLNGNHDLMLLDAASGKSDLMYYNGGNKTEQSYSKHTHIYGKRGLLNSLIKANHLMWLQNLPLYYETKDYFFSHAPIPKDAFRRNTIQIDFRLDKHALTWSYEDRPLDEWVDPILIPKEFGNEFKTCVYGHIHGGYLVADENGDDQVKTPNPQAFGNAILLDTGSGCWQGAALTCLELPARKCYNSDGKVYTLGEKV